MGGLLIDPTDGLPEDEKLRKLRKEAELLKEARRTMAVKLLAFGENPEEVMLACGVSWRTLASWVRKPDGSLTVPEKVAEAIEREAEAASQARRAKLESVRVRGEGASTEDDHRYRALLEEIEYLKKEHRGAYGVPYEYGCGNDELDEKVDLARWWFG